MDVHLDSHLRAVVGPVFKDPRFVVQMHGMDPAGGGFQIQFTGACVGWAKNGLTTERRLKEAAHGGHLGFHGDIANHVVHGARLGAECLIVQRDLGDAQTFFFDDFDLNS